MNTFAQVWAAGLVNSAISATLVAVLAWALARVVGGSRPKVRFAIWFGALLAIAIVSAATIWTSGAAGTRTAGSPFMLAESWARTLFCLWVCGVVFFLLRIAVGFYQILTLRRDSKPLDVHRTTPQVQEAVASLGREEFAGVRVSQQVEVPTAVGFFRPVVLLPAWSLSQLSAEELSAVLVHEFEHLRRRDQWSNLGQKVLGALFFFHPAVWWIERNLALEREMVCDEAVVAHTRNAKAYAACLVSLAEKNFVRRSLALAHAAVSRLHQTTIRVAKLLGGTNATQRKWKPAMFAVSALSASALVGIAMAPPLVGFQREAGVAAVASTTPASYVVPASYVPEPTRLATRALVAHGKSATPSKRVKQTSQASLLALLSTPENPVPTKASAPQAEAAHTVFVVMHTEQYDRFGGAMFTICVWRLDLPAQNAAGQTKTIPAKQI